MSRTLSGPMQTAVASSTGETVRLLELQFGGGTLRYCTGSFDLAWNSQTWAAIGGEFTHAATPESADVTNASAEITLAAVSGTIAQTIAGEKFVGRILRLYTAHLDPTTRLVIVDPISYSGIMSGGVECTEDGTTVTATIRCVSRLVALTEHRGIQLTLVSHNVHYPNDTFFEQASAQLTNTVTWGKTRIRLT